MSRRDSRLRRPSGALELRHQVEARQRHAGALAQPCPDARLTVQVSMRSHRRNARGRRATRVSGSSVGFSVRSSIPSSPLPCHRNRLPRPNATRQAQPRHRGGHFHGSIRRFCGLRDGALRASSALRPVRHNVGHRLAQMSVSV
jgi:hypothetical protein